MTIYNSPGHTSCTPDATLPPKTQEQPDAQRLGAQQAAMPTTAAQQQKDEKERRNERKPSLFPAPFTPEEKERRKIKEERGTTTSPARTHEEAPPTPGSVSGGFPAGASPTSGHVDYEAFRRYFNQTMRSRQARIPAVSLMTERRREAIRQVVRLYGKQALLEMIHRAASSRFLNGGGGKGWVANIDWLLRPNNFPKVIEGNYDDARYAPQKAADAQLQAERRAANRAIEEQVRQEERQRREEMTHRAVTYEEYRQMLARGEPLL